MSAALEYWKVLPQPLPHLGKFSQTSVEGFAHQTLILLVQLRVSQLNGCAYCVDLHSRDAAEKGESAQRISLVGAWYEAGALFTDAERAAFAWAEAMTRLSDSHLSDHTARRGALENVRKHFSEAEVAQLGYAIAAINAFNRIAVGFERGPTAR